MNTTFFKKSTIGALMVVVVATGIAFISPANATTINTDIKVSKSKLKSACGNSGGTFTTEGGKYSCVVKYKKSTTTVSCVNKRKCIGTVLPTFRIITKSRYISKRWSAGSAKR
jgi:hypothetical protein